MSKAKTQSVVEVKVNAVKAGKLGVLFSHIGDAIGTYTADAELTKIDVRTNVECMLLDAMKNHGLQVEMMKAPSKANPGELWTILVDAINAPRIGCGLPELTTGVRDNYLSKMRSFVRDRGAVPLDLFGNYAEKARKEKLAALAAKAKEVIAGAKEGELTSSEDSSEPAAAPKSKADSKPLGAEALVNFLSEFIAANNDDVELDSDMDKLLDFCDDLLTLAKNMSGKKAKSNK